jgi:GDP-D-mannose 3', 5'-epimerase
VPPSGEMITINQLADMAMAIAGKRVEKRHITGPLGVRGRNSDNRLIEEKLGWKPSQPLSDGLAVTYEWIERQVMSNSGAITRPTVPASGERLDHARI